MSVCTKKAPFFFIFTMLKIPSFKPKIKWIILVLIFDFEYFINSKNNIMNTIKTPKARYNLEGSII